MSPAQKALWYIESHLGKPLTLDEISDVAGVSRFHMVRAFAAATGFSVIRYVRARRLTEAARALAAGAPGILNIALDADYGSHEAFTRAFRDHFGVTPESVRATTCLDNLSLQEPILMDSIAHETIAHETIAHETIAYETIAPPRFETGKAMLVAGVGDRFSYERSAGIPGLWARFHQDVEGFAGRIGTVAYGVCTNPDDAGNFDYIAGVEVADFSDVPRDFSRIRIPEQRYAVFSHKEHISTIRRTISTIWNNWLPSSGYKVADAPTFERYDEKFDSVTGNGGLEIWVPIKI